MLLGKKQKDSNAIELPQDYGPRTPCCFCLRTRYGNACHWRTGELIGVAPEGLVLPVCAECREQLRGFAWASAVYT